MTIRVALRTLAREPGDERLPFGIVSGLLFGAVDVALMLPLQFQDRTTAFAAAFASRFAIGVLAATAQMPLPAWARGLVVGLLISLPDAIITKAYAPILATGVIGGTLIGWAAEKWARPEQAGGH